MCCQVRCRGRAATVRGWQPEKAAIMAISQSRMWERDSQMTSWPVLGVEADGDLVAHGAGGDEDGGFAAEDLGGGRLRGG